MNHPFRASPFLLGAFAITLVHLGGCTDEKIVYRDRELFNPPPDATSGFLGYFDPATKQTTCGNCHVGTQGEWEGSAHAGAYVTLTASGHAQDACFKCHTVGQQGNPVAAAAGWDIVPDDAYHDVQCESCHGPGYAHVQDPEASQPIASLAVPLTLDNGCAECHSGNHHPFAEEWSQSAHATVISSPAGRAECAGCHRGQAILEAWGVNATYLEKDSATHLPITCGVCHDPHGSPWQSQLRFPVDTNSAELHLCARCHNRRANPDPTSSRLSPHAPETSLLLGDAGWFPPGSDINPGQIIASHGSEGNARLCASCHVNRFTVEDAETGNFVFQATGHLFTALPCVDANGIPTSGECGYTTTDRSYLACATAGCHAGTTAAASAFTLARARIEDRAAELLTQLTTVDPGLDAAGGLIDGSDATFTVADGCFFNYKLATFGGGVEAAAAHNPFLMEGLLLASIDEMTEEYGVRSRFGDARSELRALLDRAGR